MAGTGGTDPNSVGVADPAPHDPSRDARVVLRILAEVHGDVLAAGRAGRVVAAAVVASLRWHLAAFGWESDRADAAFAEIAGAA